MVVLKDTMKHQMDRGRSKKTERRYTLCFADIYHYVIKKKYKKHRKNHYMQRNGSFKGHNGTANGKSFEKGDEKDTKKGRKRCALCFADICHYLIKKKCKYHMEKSIYAKKWYF